MELIQLIGERELSGVDTGIDFILFILDGLTYKATEDPSDGYRSYLQDLVITNEKVSYPFPPQKVFCKMDENPNRDVLQIIDLITKEIVMEIGTDETADYYPYCVMNYYPNNLSINLNITI